MDKKHLGKRKIGTQKATLKKPVVNARPSWVPKGVVEEEELCPDCFKVVGERSRYKLVCMLGKEKGGMSVTQLTERLNLQQPTVTHHLQVLRSVQAVESTRSGREQIYQLNRKAHCFSECKIPV